MNRVEVVEVVPEPREPKKYPVKPLASGQLIELVDSVSMVFQGQTNVTLWRGPQWPSPRRPVKRRQKPAGVVSVVSSLIRDHGGKALVAGTRMKVAHIAEEHTRLGMTPEQILEAHPHLTLPQVNAALAYYYGNREAIEAEMTASLAYADQARRQSGTSSLVARLRGLKAPLGIDDGLASHPAPTPNPASERLSKRMKERQ